MPPALQLAIDASEIYILRTRMRHIGRERETKATRKPEGTDGATRQSAGTVNLLFRTQDCRNHSRVAASDYRRIAAAVAGTGTSGYCGRAGNSQFGVRMGAAVDSKVARQKEKKMIAKQLWRPGSRLFRIRPTQYLLQFLGFRYILGRTKAEF